MMSFWRFGKVWGKKHENDSCWVLISECFREALVFAGVMLHAESWCFVSILVELNPLKHVKTTQEKRKASNPYSYTPTFTPFET